VKVLVVGRDDEEATEERSEHTGKRHPRAGANRQPVADQHP
jgi:hypothetical protein